MWVNKLFVWFCFVVLLEKGEGNHYFLLFIFEDKGLKKKNHWSYDLLWHETIFNRQPLGALGDQVLLLLYYGKGTEAHGEQSNLKIKQKVNDEAEISTLKYKPQTNQN